MIEYRRCIASSMLLRYNMKLKADLSFYNTTLMLDMELASQQAK